jgi:AtzE family amidohydrolase
VTDPRSSAATATDVAAIVRRGGVSAREVVEAALARIASRDGAVHAFTHVARERALRRADAIDRSIRSGQIPGPLAGAPFGVKAMIDVAGVVTTAGSALHVDDPPAATDSEVVRRLEDAGAVCIGALNMDEFGMGGTTESSCHGATHNPHDLARTPGGSSGGSAAAVAAGMVPLALGGDALGSIRLPASLCGVYGLRPTRGSVPDGGVLGAGGSIATVGALARSVRDVATSHAALTGRALREPVATASWRVATATGYFADNLDVDAAAAVELVRRALGTQHTVDFPDAARAKAAAILVNASESATGRLSDLRERPDLFHAGTRDRFLAHALLPAQWYINAQRYRAWHKERVLELFADVDVVILPATPCVAPLVGRATLTVQGQEWPTGPMLGWFTQPLAGTDCPALTVPVARAAKLPIGVQLLAAPHREDILFDVAARLEALGIAAAPVATTQGSSRS